MQMINLTSFHEEQENLQLTSGDLFFYTGTSHRWVQKCKANSVPQQMADKHPKLIIAIETLYQKAAEWHRSEQPSTESMMHFHTLIQIQ